MNNRNMPANTESVTTDLSGQVYSSCDFVDGRGLTKLEYAAIAAMQGILAYPEGGSKLETVSRDAVLIANALFDELEKSE